MSSDLREQLSEQAAEAFRYCCENPDDPFNPNIRTFVDAILAAVREALLAPEAVEAGAKALAFVYLEDRYPDQDATWRDTEEDAKEMFRAEYRAGVRASMDAAFGEGASRE